MRNTCRRGGAVFLLLTLLIIPCDRAIAASWLPTYEAWPLSVEYDSLKYEGSGGSNTVDYTCSVYAGGDILIWAYREAVSIFPGNTFLNSKKVNVGFGNKTFAKDYIVKGISYDPAIGISNIMSYSEGAPIVQ